MGENPVREAELGIVVSPRDWGERLHRFVADHGGARVRTRVMRPEDVLSEQFDVLIIDDITSFLTRRLVGRARSAGKAVLGVYDGAEFPEGNDRLRDLGVDSTIEAGASPEEFLRAVGGIFVGDDRGSGVIDVAQPLDGPPGPRHGRVTVVGGPSGGAGRTEIALALAGSFAYRGESVALVDGDDLSPSLAQRLGLSLHPNLRTAVDALHHRPGGLHDSTQVPRRLRVETLAGLANPRDWVELRPGDVVEVVRELADLRDRVVVDIAPRIEDLSFHGGPARFGLARALLAAADEVVVIGSPSPVGVARMVEWMAEAVPLLDAAIVHCVFNRAGRGSFEEREIAREFTRSYQPATLTFLPEDRRVLDAAWAGEPVASGPFTKAAMALAETVSAMAPAGASR